MEPKVVAVIVTYNRKELLVECLNAVFGQSIPVKQVIVIDNASTDGTAEELEKRGILNRKEFIYKRMEQNSGGAGGFYEGIQTSLESGCDWVWIMDDDTIPDNACLENLLIARQIVNEEVSFFASCVEGMKHEPMNVPGLNTKSTENGYSDWYKYLEFGLVKIEKATFVSLLINMKAIKQCGLPCKEFFIWGDDSEYTMRLCRNFGNAYFVGKSKVCHKRVLAESLKICSETDNNRIKNYFYLHRNNIINTFLYYGKVRGILFIIRDFLRAVTVIKYPLGFRKCSVILKGTLSGICQYNHFKQYIYTQLSCQESLKK